MRKIIGFRTEIRAHDVLRRAKKAGLKPEDSGLDAGRVEELILTASKSVNPAVLFETFPPTDPDSTALSSMPGLAFSLILATLGQKFQDAKRAVEAETPNFAAWWNVIESAALDEILRFASSLISDDAGKESCEISPLSAITDSSALKTALAKVDSGKIGVSLSDDGLSPAPTSAACLSWLAKSTAKSRK